MTSELEVAIEGAVAQLDAVHSAAQGHPVPFHATTDNERHRHQDQARALLAAWIGGETRVIHCATATRRRTTGQETHKIATLHGDRVLVTLTDRPPAFGDDLKRPRLYYLTDLDLVEAEGHRGVTVNCRECHGPHRLRINWLRGKGTSRVSKPARPTDDHPQIEQAAFAEIVGDPRPGLRSLPDLIIGLTPHREQAFRERYADQPHILTYADLWNTRRWLLPRPGQAPARIPAPDHPLFDCGARVAQWPPPDLTNTEPST